MATDGDKAVCPKARLPRQWSLQEVMQEVGTSIFPGVLGMEPRTSYTPSNCSFTESHLSLQWVLLTLDSQLGACEL